MADVSLGGSPMARETGQHRVVLTFDDGVSAKLICPESGCVPGLTCGLCGRDLQDPESTPCYDCSDGFKDECWVKTWFDNVGADELLKGSTEVTIDAEWDQDHMVANIVPSAVISNG